jgi:ankyrin repeat protein
MLECRRSSEAGAHRAAVVELCRSRNLLRVDASERDENGETGLIALAARGGSADDVRLLVAAGADVGAVAEMGRSAMFWAAQQGHAEVVEALARAGANCNQADMFGVTPLWVSSVSGHVRCVEVLLKAGADVNKASNGGNTTNATPQQAQMTFK